MRRAILFLIFALFLAMVIQPNLNKQIKETSKIDVPEKLNRKQNSSQMTQFQINVRNQKQLFVLMRVVVAAMPAIQVKAI